MQASTKIGNKSEIHVVEQTLITNLDVSSGDTFIWHKRSQIPGTMWLLRLQQGNEDVHIIYHVIVPIRPPDKTLEILEKDLKASGKKNITVIFRILSSG